MLTSHYMADVVALCERVIVIHHGRILFDGDLAALADTVAAWKTVAVALENGGGDLSAYGEVIHRDGDLVTLRVPKAETARVTARLLAEQDGARPQRRGSADRGRHRARLRQGSPVMSTAPVAFPQPGRLRSLADFYLTTMRTEVQRQFQYRAATYMYLLGMVAEPVIYLVVWTTIAEESGGTVSGLTTGELAAYYIVWTFVRQMGLVFTPYGWEWRIREGELSGQLLRPIHPIHYDVASFAGGKLGLWIFSRGERYAKRHGKLKRSG